MSAYKDLSQEEKDQFALCIKAIRADKKVGQGTCTFIDETFDDEELAELFLDVDNNFKMPTPAKAVREARSYEKLMKEQESNCQ
jgi:hypothetical protein